jgi:hypothetical protein
MTVKNDVMLPQLKALKTTDISPLIRMAGLMVPRVLNGFLPSLDEKQKNAFDKVMPVGGEKKIYVQLVGTPTPPIVIGLAQPPKMSILPEKGIKEQQIKGIRLTVDDLQLLVDRRMLNFIWHLRGQYFTILSMLPMFAPFLRLGPSGLKDMANKMKAHFKPVLDLLPGIKK